MRKHIIMAVALVFGSLAPSAEAQRAWVGRYQGYGYTPSHVYVQSSSGSAGFYYGPSLNFGSYGANAYTNYGGFSFGPNLSFSSTYQAYPGLPRTVPGSSLYVPPAVVVPAPNYYVPAAPRAEMLPAPTPGR